MARRAWSEAWADDVPDGKLTDVRKAVQVTDEETVVFSWVEWPKKVTRDAAMETMQSNEEMMNEPMPFDGKRMIFGGFSPVVTLEARHAPIGLHLVRADYVRP